MPTSPPPGRVNRPAFDSFRSHRLREVRLLRTLLIRKVSMIAWLLGVLSPTDGLAGSPPVKGL
ncbi:hypothetical protein D3C77_802770 [compost metagenome]